MSNLEYRNFKTTIELKFGILAEPEYLDKIDLNKLQERINEQLNRCEDGRYDFYSEQIAVATSCIIGYAARDCVYNGIVGCGYPEAQIISALPQDKEIQASVSFEDFKVGKVERCF